MSMMEEEVRVWEEVAEVEGEVIIPTHHTRLLTVSTTMFLPTLTSTIRAT